MKDNITKTVIRKEERRDSDNKYSYELTMKKSACVASWQIPLYSITVNMTDKNGNDTRADATDAFSNAEKAIKFYEKVVNNLATPIDLVYILEDEMCE